MIWSSFFKNFYNTKPSSQFALAGYNSYSNLVVGMSIIDFNRSNLIPLNNISYVNGASSNTIKGLDERNLSFLNITEPSEEDIFLNYCKYNLLSLFLDSDKSIIEKIDQFNKNIHLFSNEVYNIMNITNGGLMDEWNYENF
tara:strand:- start:10059 stop:10481 length:423 start_codon:yes stop_codon:yes gene_type:complete